MLKLLRNLRRQEWAMAAVCAVLILGQINFDLALPDYMSSLTVLIKTPGSTLSDILHTGLEMLGCTLASAVLCVICGYLTAKVAAGFSFSIREAVFHKIADFGQQEMMTFSVPSLINRTTNDITQVQMLTAMGLQILIKSPVMAVWAIIKIVGKSWTLSAITAGFVAALLVMMAVIIGVVVPRFRRVQKLTDHINLVARENLNGINVVHAYNAEDYQNAKFWKGNEELMRTQLFNQRAFAFLMPGVTLAMNALSLVIYWVGASIVNAVPAADTAARLAAFSDIVVFGTYATYVIMSIMMMVMIIMMLPAAQVSAQRINEVLETRNSLTQGARIDALETGTVEFRDVSFHYPSSDKNVLEHITFQAKRGETVAFIGATGSGKTTLVSLAARFYDATEGTVLVDGVDVRDYTFDALYGPGQRVCGQDARRHPCPHRRGRHQRIRRPEAAALHRTGPGEAPGDPGVRRLLLRPGLPDGYQAPCRPGPGAEGYHSTDRGSTDRHHPERGQDHRSGRGEDGGDGYPRGTDANLPDLPGDRPVPALPGRAGGLRRKPRCQR